MAIIVLVSMETYRYMLLELGREFRSSCFFLIDKEFFCVVLPVPGFVYMVLMIWILVAKKFAIARMLASENVCVVQI